MLCLLLNIFLVLYEKLMNATTQWKSNWFHFNQIEIAFKFENCAT
jgi:hypothetical protein